MSTVVAFMQNMWVRDPERVHRLIERRGEDYRRRIIHYALFAGCLSGRRLKTAFGEELCAAIKWDEASREITGASNGCPAADIFHISAVIDHHKPSIVICFGNVARPAVQSIWRGPLVIAPHPASRKSDAPARLGAANIQLRNLMEAKP